MEEFKRYEDEKLDFLGDEIEGSTGCRTEKYMKKRNTKTFVGIQKTKIVLR